jgi:hypothetical protein
MKGLLSLHPTPSLKALKQETKVTPFYRSPYLRAVLSEKRTQTPGKVLSMDNSSMAAALRYITNSNKPH